MKKELKSVVKSIRLTEHQYQELSRAATAKGTTVANIMRMLVDDFIEDIELFLAD